MIYNVSFLANKFILIFLYHLHKRWDYEDFLSFICPPRQWYNNAGLSLLLCTCTCTICQHKCLYRYIMLLKMICVRDSKDLISVGRLDRCSIKLQFTEKKNLKKSYICKTYRSAAKITLVMLSLKINFFWTVAFSVLNILKNHKSWCLKEDVQFGLIVCHHLDWCF